MIDRDDLRRVMELEGYDAETIDEVLARCYRVPCPLEAVESLLNLLRLYVVEATQSLAELFEAITDAQQVPLPAKLPRPPRDTRPKNMAAYRTPRPARVARSSCRKIHR